MTAAPTTRLSRNAANLKAVNELECQGVTDFVQYTLWVLGKYSKHVYETSDTTNGMIDYGQSACFANEIKPVKSIIDDFMNKVEKASQIINTKLSR